jgi:hypothetical protein
MEATEITTSGAGKGFKIAAVSDWPHWKRKCLLMYVVKRLWLKLKPKKLSNKIDGKSH